VNGGSLLVLMAPAGCGEARFGRVWRGSRSAMQSATQVEGSWLFVRSPGGADVADEFDPGAPALIAALKTAIPMDSGIQSLK
jgi:hypothetical protein